MEAYLLELVIQSLPFQADEIQLALSSCVRIFYMPFNNIITELTSEISEVPIRFYFKGVLLYQDKLNPLDSFKILESLDKKSTFDIQIKLKPLQKVKTEPYSLQLSKLKQVCKEKSSKFMKKASAPVAFITTLDVLKCENTEQHVKFLEGIVTGIEKKLKSSEIKGLYDESTKKLYDLIVKLPETCKKLYSDSIAKAQESLTEKEKSIRLLKSSISSLQKALEAAKTTSASTSQKDEKLTSELSFAKNELIKLKLDQRNFGAMNKTIEELTILHAVKDETIDRLKKTLASQTKEFSNTADMLQFTIDSLTQENQSLRSHCNSLTFKVQQISNENENLKHELNETSSRSIGDNRSFDMFEKWVNERRPQFNAIHTSELLLQIEKLNQINKDQTQQFRLEKAGLLNRIEKLTQENLELKKNISPSKTADSINFVQRYSQRESLAVLEQLKKLTTHCSSLITDSSQSFKSSISQHSDIYESSDFISHRLLDTSRNLKDYSNAMQKLLAVIKECKIENLALREKLFEAQLCTPLYVPVKNDAIDLAMAQYVNSLRRPLKIPFVRQDYGFYLFGSRNVRIRIVGKRLVVVFPDIVIPIEEFAIKYTREEVNKFEELKRNDAFEELMNMKKRSNTMTVEELLGTNSPTATEAHGRHSLMGRSVSGSLFEISLKSDSPVKVALSPRKAPTTPKNKTPKSFNARKVVIRK